jgi:NAD(P)-dependent dehydrogenase (short-subunit alcohol dehydrogenase family)
MTVTAPKDYPRPPFSEQRQPMPGKTVEMNPKPDHGEESYKGSGRLKDRVALITGGDSGIGRATAIAFAREGADVVIAYLEEDQDAQDTVEWIEKAGRRGIAIAGDVGNQAHCRSLVDQTMQEFGRLDILVNNAAHQASFTELDDITAEEWEATFQTNINAMFYLCKEATKHMQPGSAIINTASINSTDPSPSLLAYATTKGAIANFTAGLGGLLAAKGIRVNAVAPGPIWTPLIPSTMPMKKVENFGKSTPMGRPGQPAELAPTYVLLASPESSFTTGAVYEITGGRPMI